jgi:signal transduction histidine kinase
MPRRFLDDYGELLLVGGLGAFAQAELWLDAANAEDRRWLAPIALGMTAALLLRIRAPLLAVLLCVAGFQLVAVMSPPESDDPMTMVLMLIVAVYSAGAHTAGRRLAVASAMVAVAIVLAMIQDGDSVNLGGLLFFGFFIGGPFLVGVMVRIRREREGILTRERDERARAAVAEERTRIARELHDVVAHAVSVMVLQARGGRKLLADEPDAAVGAFDTIERTGQQALGEMRRLLGALRTDDEALALAPQPSLARLDALAASVSEAGLPVEIRVDGDPAELPPGVDVSAYRIVQEALTNALKHAGPARAVVRVRYGHGEVEIEVADDGRGDVNGHEPGGHGLVGIRERVNVYGGDFDAGQRPDGGYAVRATLPFEVQR